MLYRSGDGTITNDDPIPDVSIDDQSIAEGDVGTSTLTFHVTLSNPSDQTVRSEERRVGNRAKIADREYTTTYRTRTFDQGQPANSVDVTVNGDTLYVTHETVSEVTA